ncbi:MAG: ABC transporter substrate-binding protein [Chloroflexi bacterium]|nr:ABC transporter substrate-binding protein [Chloroflexota bacterium]
MKKAWANRALGLAVAVLLAATSLLACAKPATTATTSTATTSPRATASTTPKQTEPYGEMKIAMTTFGSEKFYPPTTEQGLLVTTLAPMYDLLFTLKGNDLGPNVIDKWVMAPDALSWEYSVHPGIKFHNGDEMTAEDVAFSLEQYAAKDAMTSELKTAFDRATILDKYTLRVYTKGPQLDFPAFSMEISPSRGLVLPKKYLQQNGVPYFEQHPVGTGPFKFVKRTPGDNISYEANTSYWRQPPAFKNLTIMLVPEETTSVAMLKTQMADVIEVGIETARALPAPDYRTFVTQVFGSFILFHGTTLPSASKMPAADVRVRQALSLAVNREEIIKTMFYGQASAPMPTNLSEISQHVDTPRWKNYAASVLNVYDPEKARQLLKDAGYPQGFSIDIWTFTQQGAPYLPSIAQVISGYWAKIGVKGNIVPSDWGTFQKLARSQPVNSQLVGQTSIRRSDVGPFTRKNIASYYGSPASYPGYDALLGDTRPDLDKVLAQGASEKDPEKVKELFSQAIQMAADTGVLSMLVNAPGLGAAGPRVDISFGRPQAITIAYAAAIAKHR